MTLELAAKILAARMAHVRIQAGLEVPPELLEALTDPSVRQWFNEHKEELAQPPTPKRRKGDSNEH